MGNKLYVGNLPYSFRDEDLQQAFSKHTAPSPAPKSWWNVTLAAQKVSALSKWAMMHKLKLLLLPWMVSNLVAVVSLWTKPVRWNPVLPVQVAALAVVVVAATVVALAAAGSGGGGYGGGAGGGRSGGGGGGYGGGRSSY